MQSSELGQDWHCLSTVECLNKLNSNDEGLSASQANQALNVFGPNQLPEAKPTSVIILFLRQFKEIMTIILLVAVVISAGLGEFTDALIILIILMLNATLSTFQEFRSQQALLALKKLASPHVKVKRGNAVVVLPTKDVVPGDIVFLEQGDIVPADIRLLSVQELQIDESALTGESVAAIKQVEEINAGKLTLGDKTNLAFKSSVVVLGRAHGLVVATGINTEIGRIASLLTEEKQAKTPLQIRLSVFSKYLVVAILCVCAIVLFAGLAQGQPFFLMVLTSLSLAVAAVPEALPAVITISLALGASKLLKQHALIRNLPAVETLGAVTYICTDKTGTLTENKMVANELFDGTAGFATLTKEHYLLGVGLAISNDVETSNGQVLGEATEIALFNMAVTNQFEKSKLLDTFPLVSTIPFDSERKMMTTIHRFESGFISFTKGAPERIIANCKQNEYGSKTNDFNKSALLNQVDELSSQGSRVLAIAMHKFDALPNNNDLKSLETDLIFLGLIAISDPIRSEVPDAVNSCISAGITPVMITGDHQGTAIAIAKQLGLGKGIIVSLNGDELYELSDADFADQVENTNVYTRVSPEQKLKIVRALQKQGHFVAMTGDGVNDAPALQHANIGVAMGKKGTDVARSAADMILLNDDFSTIVTAVSAGRRIYDNIRKFIKYTMSSNAGEIWTLLVAPIMGMPIPLLPIHILWINLITDGLPGLAFSAEPAEKNIMQTLPRKQNESIFANGMWQHILWVGLLIGLLCLGTLHWALSQELVYWQTMVFSVLVFAQLFHSIAVRSDTESILTLGLFTNLFLMVAVLISVILQLSLIYVPILNDLFSTQALPISHLLLCIAIASVVLVAVEFEKLLIRRGLLYSSNIKVVI